MSSIPITVLTANFSLILRMASPLLGSLTDGRALHCQMPAYFALINFHAPILTTIAAARAHCNDLAGLKQWMLMACQLNGPDVKNGE